MTSLGSMVAQAGEQDRVGHQVANHAKPALRLRRPASADRAGCLDSAIGHNRLLDLESLNSPTLPAPASASARLQSTPHTSVGDGADAIIPPEASGTARKAPSGSLSGEPSRHALAIRTIGVKHQDMIARETGRGEAEHSSRLVFNSGDGLGIHEPGSITWGGLIATPAPSGRARDRAKCPAVAGSLSLNPTLHSRASDKLAASAVLRGAASFSFPNPARWVRQAVVTSSLSSPTMSVTAADPGACGFSNMLSVHHAHDVRGDALAIEPFLHGCAGCECDDQSQRSDNYFEHFEISEPMVGVNTA